jgi:hypothetical protein
MNNMSITTVEKTSLEQERPQIEHKQGIRFQFQWINISMSGQPLL